MRFLAIFATVFVAPALANEEPKSEAGTAFMERCLKDVTEHRIETLKRQAPDYAASLSEDELAAGGMSKARRACPCFLHIIAIDSALDDETPEGRAAIVVSYLESLGSEDTLAMPTTIPRLTRMCGERSSVLPPSWVGG